MRRCPAAIFGNSNISSEHYERLTGLWCGICRPDLLLLAVLQIRRALEASGPSCPALTSSPTTT